MKRCSVVLFVLACYGCAYPDRVAVRDAGVRDAGVRLPRPRSPMSTSRVTTTHPSLTFDRGDAESLRVEVCRDRGCRDRVETLTPGSGERAVRPTVDLTARPARVYFWRLVSRLPGSAADVVSPTWEFFVPAVPLTTSREASYGTELDLNGDGLAEVVASAPGPGSEEVARDLGAVYLFAGRPDFDSNRGAPAVLRIATSRVFGGDVAGAGDVNGDGYGDLLVGSMGAAYLYPGGPGGLGGVAPRSLVMPPDARYFGAKVAAAGDLDDDGYGDVLVTAFRAFNEGRAFVYYGDASGDLRRSVELPNPRGLTSYGQSVAGAGDVNGDGHPDVFVGAPGASDELRLQVLAGDGRALGNPSALTASDVESLGVATALAGDVNGDGYADFIAASNHSTVNGVPLAGLAFVYHGRNVVLPSTSTTSLRARNPVLYQRFGASLAGGGDVNGDGYDDVLVGTYLTDRDNSANTVMLFVGGPDGVATAGVELYSAPLSLAGSGTEVGIPGDLNGDGYDDVVVGAPGYERGAGAGAVYVYLGGPSPSGGDARIEVQVPSVSHRFFGAAVASQ